MKQKSEKGEEDVQIVDMSYTCVAYKQSNPIQNRQPTLAEQPSKADKESDQGIENTNQPTNHASGITKRKRRLPAKTRLTSWY